MLATEDRKQLADFLSRRFNLDELEQLLFEVGLDAEDLPHRTRPQLCRAIVTHFERRGTVRFLVEQVLHLRPDPTLAQLLARLPVGERRQKVVMVIAEELVGPNPLEEFRQWLAQRLSIAADEVAIQVAVTGSTRLLLGLPEGAARALVAQSPRALSDGRYHVLSVTLFDALPPAEQQRWYEGWTERQLLAGLPRGAGPAGSGWLAALAVVLLSVASALLIVTLARRGVGPGENGAVLPATLTAGLPVPPPTGTREATPSPGERARRATRTRAARPATRTPRALVAALPPDTPTRRVRPVTATPTRSPAPPITEPPTVKPLPITATPTETPPLDSEGPPAPPLFQPPNGATLDCGVAVLLLWGAAQDPSGIAQYEARLETWSGNEWLEVRTWVDKLTEANASGDVKCGHFYRWNVRAQDGVGNPGEPSEWFSFGMAVP